MEIDVWQLQNIIKAAAKEAVSEYAISKDPVIDEITETQAIRLGKGLVYIGIVLKFIR